MFLAARISYIRFFTAVQIYEFIDLKSLFITVLSYPEIQFSEMLFGNKQRAVSSVSFRNIVVRFLEHYRTTLNTMVSNVTHNLGERSNSGPARNHL